MAEGGQLYCWSRNRSFGDMGALAAAWTEGRLRRLREPCATALPALTSPDANAANLDDRNSGMPTVLRSGPYGIYFYSHDPNEPPHVHVESDQASRKIWLAPVALASSLGFKANELGEVLRLVSAKHTSLLKAWEDFHG